MKTIFSIAVFNALCISGCSLQGVRYANAHPGLSPVHRQILVTGKIPSGRAVEGMTKEQVSLAMGKPARAEKYDGQDVWLYTKETGFPYVADSQFNPEWADIVNLGDLGDCPMSEKRTAIFFKGDRATVALISNR